MPLTIFSATFRSSRGWRRRRCALTKSGVVLISHKFLFFLCSMPLPLRDFKRGCAHEPILCFVWLLIGSCHCSAKKRVVLGRWTLFLAPLEIWSRVHRLLPRKLRPRWRRENLQRLRSMWLESCTASRRRKAPCSTSSSQNCKIVS